jgi:hypothetical protein
LVETLARVLRKEFTSLMEIVIPPVTRLCGRTNKVFVKRATRCLENAVHYTQLPEFIPYFAEMQNSQSKTMRKGAIDGLNAVLSRLSATDMQAYVVQIETMLRASLVDADATVRAEARKAYELYAKAFETRVAT